MRFVWNTFNRSKVLGHHVTEKTAEQVAQVAEYAPSKDGIAMAGIGELNGIRYRIVVMMGQVTDEVYIVNCYRLTRGRGKSK